MCSRDVEAEVCRVLVVLMQLEQEVASPLSLSEVLALDVQAEVVAGKLRRMQRELASAMHWLESFEPTFGLQPPEAQSGQVMWGSVAEMVVRGASAA